MNTSIASHSERQESVAPNEPPTARWEHPCAFWPYGHAIRLLTLVQLQHCSVIACAPLENLFIALLQLHCLSGTAGRLEWAAKLCKLSTPIRRFRPLVSRNCQLCTLHSRCLSLMDQAQHRQVPSPPQPTRVVLSGPGAGALKTAPGLEAWCCHNALAPCPHKLDNRGRTEMSDVHTCL